jgi:hypothetical protein
VKKLQTPALGHSSSPIFYNMLFEEKENISNSFFHQYPSRCNPYFSEDSIFCRRMDNSFIALSLEKHQKEEIRK